MILTTAHIRQVISGFFETRPVRKVWLFGSYARGDADENSDVDVFVDIDYNSLVGLEYFSWREDLAKELQKKVDIS